MIPDLRDYQIATVEKLRDGIRAGHRAQLVVAPTGSGKSVVASYLTYEAQQKGSRVNFIVDRVAICEQISRMFWSYDIIHGMAQGGNTFGRNEPIQVCSAQTLEARGTFPECALGIYDEAHITRRVITEYLRNTSAKVIGLTATPFAKGMGETYTNVVNVTTTNELVRRGYLAPLKVYVAVKADMTGAKTVAGEWSDKEVEERGKAIIGDIVTEWIGKTEQHFNGPVKTLVFSATVDHGEQICRQFQAAGHNFQQVSYKDGNDERRAKKIAEFRKPESEIVGLVSCEALGRGFDVPDILCMVAARPYRRSFSSHIQQIGRGMRTAVGKEFCLLLDHTGNYLGFLPEMENLFEHGVQKLDNGEIDKTIRREVEEDDSPFLCRNCNVVMSPAATVCLSCGWERPRKSIITTLPGVMTEIDPRAKPRIKEYLDRPRNVVWGEICRVAVDRKGDDIEAARRFAMAQYKTFFDEFPPYHFPFEPANACDYRLESHIRANLIRYAKSKRA